MVKLSYDLHIHSCLSPCGDEDMTPGNIVGMAAIKELDVIAVTDHNSCKNCPAVMELVKEYDIVAIPGMELCTQEEVHVLCLFADLQDAMDFDSYVSSRLLRIPNDEQIFGKQEIYDAKDCKIGTEPYLLINAADIPFDELKELMKKFHGIAIPAHMDKNTNSLLSNLGFIPPDSDFTCAELKDIGKREDLTGRNPYLKKCNIITNSDAHSLGLIHEPVYYLYAESKSPMDIIKALSEQREE
ncbi:MAG: putative metal-dependent phosphoesterase family [Herbinix sp.]|jgi:PHP family Zn ribbon phosphoesterase|nr:putative metal-dependent phosphoesterase family [Herbinix sp.]